MSHDLGSSLAAFRPRGLFLAALFCIGSGWCQSDSGGIAVIESDTDRWIELQSQIARSKNEWKSERALLESSIEILEAERKTLEQAIESNATASEVYTTNRDRLKAKVEEQRESLQSLAEPLRLLETKVKLLAPRLPEPLKREVNSHLSKVDAANAPVTSRAQSLVASLTAIDRFSNSLSSHRVARPAPNGGEVSVRVLYWGLAVAYGVDEANGRAWVIRPGPSGWDWQQRDEIFGPVLELIESYESDTENPRLIELPATLS
ncbi:DUF3450 family protein [Pelagicoccus sp. SDUM812005]|uniref:DUF3450 family protein n=1 Tax=Pelagicoccus sp. SDUM812005 TaxID=3041257 RepID=UPI00280F2F2C|nr:DUF3450 family protein [Pelagicoccus sp. SDUM812005]MDQ8181240.1 DUF3450 family protein [Pelagicoccus sp. SDUM812005]